MLKLRSTVLIAVLSSTSSFAFVLMHCGSFGESDSDPAADATTSDGGPLSDRPTPPVIEGGLPILDSALLVDSNGPAKKIAFITSQTFKGSLGGLANADQTCTSIANTVGLGGQYVAWLTMPGTSMTARLNLNGDPNRVWVDTKGELVGSATSLVSNEVRLTLNELQAPIANGKNVWTGTTGEGNPTGQNCMMWLSDQENNAATTGAVGETGDRWTNAEQQNCESVNGIYCFQK